MSNNPLAGTAIGFGTMSLCIENDRPTEAESIRMIEELIDEAGLNFIDTADAYCLNEKEFGYGDRIVSKFMGRKNVIVATKGGFTRPEGAWKPCGNPAYLRAACEASLKNMGAETIDLYQYHRPDPTVPYADSLGELARLREEGKIKHIGISNASLKQLTLAKEIVDVSSIQNQLSVLGYQAKWDDPIFRFCEANDVAFIAYGPLTGHLTPYMLETLSERFNQAARERSLTPYQLALLGLRGLSPTIIPIPGSTSKQHVLENLSVSKITLAQDVVSEINAMLREDVKKPKAKNLV